VKVKHTFMKLQLKFDYPLKIIFGCFAFLLNDAHIID